MGFWPLLFFMTLAESVTAYFIYVVYHYVVFPDLTKGSMVRLVLYLGPFNVALLVLVDKIAGSANGFFFSPGQAGKNLYSRERGLAKNGDREEACQRLEKAVKKKGDIEALRLLIEIASDQPVMHVWMSKASGLRGKIKGLTKEDHAGFEMMLSRGRKREIKEEAFF